MNEKRRTVDGGMLVGGVVLIAIGVAFLLDRIEIPNFWTLITVYWPMLVVAVGLSKLFEAQTIWAGLWIVSIGTWLQAVRLHWHGFTYINSWPLLLMVLGGGIVLRTVIDPLMRHLYGEGHGSQQ